MKDKIQSIIDHASDVADASRKLEEAARSDRELRDYLTEPYLKQACYNAVRSHYRVERREIWTAPNYTKGGNGQRVEQHARTLLDFPLPNGKRLRDATREDLLSAAEFYRRQSEDMAQKAHWLERIAEKTGRKKVGAALTVKQIESLRGETETV